MPTPSYVDLFTRLEKRVDDGFTALGESLKGVEHRLRTLETSEAGCRGVQELKIVAIEDQQKDHKSRLKEIEKWIPAVKVLVWIGGVLGVSVIGLIWGIITHAVEILVK